MNEPVAYMMESPSAKWFLLKPDECLPNETCTPLYTHPMRELTEDEIREVADSVCHTWKKNGVGELYMTDFARAILKKARGE